MNPSTDNDWAEQAAAGPVEPPPTPRQALAPTVAVLAVAVAAVAAAVMTHRADAPAPAATLAAATPAKLSVVTAPPLSRPGAQAMGGTAVCATCGVVESVAVAAPGKAFRMRIRMDDGSVRTVEQRGALPAGSRVAISGDALKLIPG
ncbi:hypothetical protein [Caenimonas aquaedulcis]|uniref:Uncharacterized protein n=1 Tax=Caenimonas aquaedulcis TaxID=2793270 RepID=A0A931H7W5_9BURK|nr:hypothetical protein [Caenimonas aquaedulcis]MBG9390329.1 hypothetical protein [Caenimonas aquaedulcis]